MFIRLKADLRSGATRLEAVLMILIACSIAAGAYFCLRSSNGSNRDGIETSRVSSALPSRSLTHPLEMEGSIRAPASEAKQVQLSSPRLAQANQSAAKSPSTSEQQAPDLSQTAGDSLPPPAPEAFASIGGVSHEMAANSIGSYPRYTVDPKASIPVTIKLVPKEEVDLEVLDGGKLNGKYSALSEIADNQGNVNVNFQVQSGPGSYRVAVMRTGTRSVLNFWVGPELPGRVPSTSP